MKFTEILEELRKGKKVTREKWGECKTECYKYIKLEHGEIIAYLKDDNGEDKVKERTKCMFELADFTAEDWKLYKEKKTNKKWKPQYGEKYYTISTRGTIDFDNFVAENNTDAVRLLLGNVFETEEEAEHMLEKIKIINKLRELSNISFNDNCKQEKFVIFYNTENQQIRITQNTFIREIPFNIYFKNKEDCQKAIEIIGEDNLKKYYFDVED